MKKKKYKKSNLIITFDPEAKYLLDKLKIDVDHFNICSEELMNLYGPDSWIFEDTIFDLMKDNIANKIKHKKNIILLSSKTTGIYGAILKSFIDYFSKKQKHLKIVSYFQDYAAFNIYANYKNIPFINIWNNKQYQEKLKTYREKRAAILEYWGLMNTEILSQIEKVLI